MSTIRFFSSGDPDFQITEFGYSSPHSSRIVGPWVRDTYILHYVQEGTCHFSEFDVTAGEVFLISKNTLHHFTVHPPYTHYWFAFDGKDVPQIFSKYGIPLHTHIRCKILYREIAENALQAAFSAAENESGEAAAKSALFALLPLLQLQNENFSRQQDDRMQTIADFLETHYPSSLTMEQVAKTVHLSEKYVCKQFKKHYGVPPQQYLLKVRMERAKLLLKTTDLQITEVAKSVGYASPAVFSAAFRKFTRFSPSDFRNHI